MTLLEEGIRNEEITFYSDSQAILKALKKKTIENSFTIRCYENLNELGRNNKVYVNCIIPGHRGYEGNETADKLAKEGSKREIMTNQYERPMAYLMQEIKKHTRKDITKNYRETGENSQIITDQLIIAAKGSRKKTKGVDSKQKPRGSLHPLKSAKWTQQLKPPPNQNGSILRRRM